MFYTFTTLLQTIRQKLDALQQQHQNQLGLLPSSWQPQTLQDFIHAKTSTAQNDNFLVWARLAMSSHSPIHRRERWNCNLRRVCLPDQFNAVNASLALENTGVVYSSVIFCLDKVLEANKSNKSSYPYGFNILNFHLQFCI